MYINGNPDLSDPSNKVEARNYALGLNRVGVAPVPCSFAFGEVRGGVDCNLVDPRFWFSGDPVANGGDGVGWICTENRDMRQMTNTGPFVLKKDEENEIVLAYVVGKGVNPLDGITVARAIDDGAQTIFDLNFLAPSPPPAPVVTLSSSDDFIDISWDTPAQVTYVNSQPSWDLKFEGYQVFAFKQNITEDFVDGQPNSVLIGSYDLADFIENIYLENSQNGGIDLLYPVGTQLDSTIYMDPATGRIRLRIYNDPFETNIPVTKGKPYYFAVTSYALNYDALRYKPDPSIPLSEETVGDYYLDAGSFAQQAENIRTINSILVGESALNPPVPVQPSNQISGASMGEVGYDVINNDELTGQTYEVTFFKNDTSVAYSMFWKLNNLSTGALLQDSMLSYTYGSSVVDQPLTDGFITKVEDQDAAIGLPTYNPPGDLWYNFNGTPVDSIYTRGIYYPGKDLVLQTPYNKTQTLPQPYYKPNHPYPDTIKSTYITTDKMRKVEIRFGEEGFGKAYRYLTGYKRPPIPGQGSAATNWLFAEAITSADTISGTQTYPIGNWDEVNNRPFGFVDVPFQAWVVDEQYNEEYQLAVGFIESRQAGQLFSGRKSRWYLESRSRYTEDR